MMRKLHPTFRQAAESKGYEILEEHVAANGHILAIVKNSENILVSARAPGTPSDTTRGPKNWASQLVNTFRRIEETGREANSVLIQLNEDPELMLFHSVEQGYGRDVHHWYLQKELVLNTKNPGVSTYVGHYLEGFQLIEEIKLEKHLQKPGRKFFKISEQGRNVLKKKDKGLAETIESPETPEIPAEPMQVLNEVDISPQVQIPISNTVPSVLALMEGLENDEIEFVINYGLMALEEDLSMRARKAEEALENLKRRSVTISERLVHLNG